MIVVKMFHHSWYRFIPWRMASVDRFVKFYKDSRVGRQDCWLIYFIFAISLMITQNFKIFSKLNQFNGQKYHTLNEAALSA